MSAKNRKLPVGVHKVKYESKLSMLMGRIVCLFKGHKKVNVFGKDYCISCWKKL